MKNVVIAAVILLATVGMACSTPRQSGYTPPTTTHQWTDPVYKMCFQNCRPGLMKVVDNPT